MATQFEFGYDMARFINFRDRETCERVRRITRTQLTEHPSADFRIRTRAQSLGHPTQLASRIFAVGRDLLAREIDGTMFRLIGIGLSSLCEADGADFADLIDRRSAGAEQAMDRLRERFGDEAVVKGLALEAEQDD